MLRYWLIIFLWFITQCLIEFESKLIFKKAYYKANPFFRSINKYTQLPEIQKRHSQVKYKQRKFNYKRDWPNPLQKLSYSEGSSANLMNQVENKEPGYNGEEKIKSNQILKRQDPYLLDAYYGGHRPIANEHLSAKAALPISNEGKWEWINNEWKWMIPANSVEMQQSNNAYKQNQIAPQNQIVPQNQIFPQNQMAPQNQAASAYQQQLKVNPAQEGQQEGKWLWINDKWEFIPVVNNKAPQPQQSDVSHLYYGQ